MDLPIQHDVPLAPFCTLALGGPARHFVAVDSDASLGAALAWAHARSLRVAILGGGSNLLVRDEGFDGLVVHVALRGLAVAPADGKVLVTVSAGEPWDSVVARAVHERWAGLECLSWIPGLTGATPIQNVGAYGQEVADTIRAVRVLDASGSVREIAPAACGFAYRDSAFKRREAGLDRAVVLAVTFALEPEGHANITYAELSRALGGTTAPLADVRAAVLALRRSKSMVIDPDDENRRSVGSFFTNPIVSRAEANAVVGRALASRWVARGEDVPRFAQRDGRVKLAAAWLIERSGFHKGERRGAFGISSKHALALVHHGGGRTADLLAFADEIVARVRAITGVTLEREPVVW